MANERLNRFTALLKQIFELDKSDLDFGIYRVMNLRKTEMKEFSAQHFKNIAEILTRARRSELGNNEDLGDQGFGQTRD